MFIDEAVIHVEGGRGGNGSDAVRVLRLKRKRVPEGGPGGPGGAVALVADERIATLLDLKLKPHYRAEAGRHGGRNKRRGRTGRDIEIRVPVGSVVEDERHGDHLRDLVVPGERLVVARGGRGGSANGRNRPATAGTPGEERALRIVLKLIADVGIVGFPNCGKSTLLNALTGAKSKVAAYPFSTLSPELGVLEDPETYERLVLCDIPGLIEGAHAGRGLGSTFLRHIERTRLLLHLVEMQEAAGMGPLERFEKMNSELAGYDRDLLKKPQVVVASKMDLKGAEKLCQEFQRLVGKPVLGVSAQSGLGLGVLRRDVFKAVRALARDEGIAKGAS
ncbi:MAG: Obg family GTPase CgtA [Candidatus Omnitrophica bacterium]|nr:Obg family GTPase CgtA [Candidatus Omnitrophota bacterium]